MECSDHDLLIEVNERTRSIKTILCNHLKHHFTINIIILAAALSAFVSMLLLIVKK